MPFVAEAYPKCGMTCQWERINGGYRLPKPVKSAISWLVKMPLDE
jgi:hypothetical protein